jgi:hypothetical protein
MKKKLSLSHHPCNTGFAASQPGSPKAPTSAHFTFKQLFAVVCVLLPLGGQWDRRWKAGPPSRSSPLSERDPPESSAPVRRQHSGGRMRSPCSTCEGRHTLELYS